MMAANWVLSTLLLSLCIATSYGKRTGVSAMDDRVEKDVFQPSSGSMYERHHGSSTPIDPEPVVDPEPIVDLPPPVYERSPYCSSCDNVDIIGGCCGGSCNYGCNGFGVGIGSADLNGLKQTIRDFTMKLEANGLLGQKKGKNMQTMTPGSS